MSVTIVTSTIDSAGRVRRPLSWMEPMMELLLRGPTTARDLARRCKLTRRRAEQIFVKLAAEKKVRASGERAGENNATEWVLAGAPEQGA